MIHIMCCSCVAVATHYNTLQHTVPLVCVRQESDNVLQSCCSCNTLQHTATHCNTLQHTATHCNTLQPTVTLISVLHHTATHCKTLQHTATHACSLLRDTILQHDVISSLITTGCLKLQVFFCKRATNYRALLRKLTCKMRLRHPVSAGRLPRQ